MYLIRGQSCVKGVLEEISQCGHNIKDCLEDASDSTEDLGEGGSYL